MGATAVETAQKLINGESVEKSIPVEVKLVTKDNVDE
jgi:ribose transport system substrate-binding protein